MPAVMWSGARSRGSRMPRREQASGGFSSWNRTPMPQRLRRNAEHSLRLAVIETNEQAHGRLPVGFSYPAMRLLTPGAIGVIRRDPFHDRLIRAAAIRDHEPGFQNVVLG